MIQGMRIGWVLCGSFCTFEKVSAEMQRCINEGAVLTPILSYAAASTDTRFGTADRWKHTLAEITGHTPMTSLTDVEPIGPKRMFDALVVAPCTGTTLGKLANGISDTPAALAVKSHLRSGNPVVIAVSTNDALGASFRNIALLKNTKNLYLVPMVQDDIRNKPNSLVADFSRIPEAVHAAREGKQLLPLFET